VIEPRSTGAARRRAAAGCERAVRELSAVLDELIQARTRASVLAKSLFARASTSTCCGAR
jgi:hypothetical protein